MGETTHTRRAAVRLLIGLIILLAMLLLYPVRTMLYRTGIVACLAGIDFLVAVLLWKRKIVRWVPIGVAALIVLFLAAPGRAVDAGALRAAYLARLQGYEGTRYVWGGETCLGVDCSGFLRASLIDAHISESLRTLNPALARRASESLKWHDALTREFAEGYDGRTIPIGETALLRDLSLDVLMPGDFAVTADGAHVLAYLGDGQWIED